MSTPHWTNRGNKKLIGKVYLASPSAMAAMKEQHFNREEKHDFQHEWKTGKSKKVNNEQLK